MNCNVEKIRNITNDDLMKISRSLSQIQAAALSTCSYLEYSLPESNPQTNNILYMLDTIEELSKMADNKLSEIMDKLFAIYTELEESRGGKNMPSRGALFADYLKTIDDIQELILNNAEFDIQPTIQAGEKSNEIIVPRLVMDEPADYSKPVCGTVNIVPKTVQFKHNITPQMIEKGFAHFVEFVNAFRRELEEQNGRI